jgi:hypothetical protein
VYTIIRVDLPIEAQIVQAAHSALEAGRELDRPDQPSHLILLEAKSEEHLKKISRDLTDIGIKFHMFFEPDYNRGYTSLTTQPLSTAEQRKYFRSLKLYKYRPANSYSVRDEQHLLEI